MRSAPEERGVPFLRRYDSSAAYYRELDFEFTPPLGRSIRSTILPPLSSMVWKLDTLPPKHAAIDRPGTWAEEDKTRGQTCQHDRRSFEAG